MRLRWFLFQIVTVFPAFGSAESEHEPALHQISVIGSAVESLQESKVSELTSIYSEAEKTGYYLKDISFLGRYQTKDGSKILFQCLFIRSSPYRESAITPPRGHSFIVVLDDDFRYLNHLRTERDATIEVRDGIVFADGIRVVDLATPSKTEQGAAANR